MNIYDIWFSRVDISNSIKLKLLQNFDVFEVFNLKSDELKNLGLQDITINKILDKTYRENLENYEQYLIKHQIYLISFKSELYPNKLKDIPDMPVYLFVRGNIDILDDDSVAIVGSRNCSNEGKKTAYNVAKELCDKNINVISGLALGIDTFAHMGSLSGKYGKTIAVLANGLAISDIYPQENLNLAKKIVLSGGAIVSEYIAGTKSKKYYFPIRNRIVSGLSDKILVVEANRKSGTLITVRTWVRTRKRYFCCTRKYLFWKFTRYKFVDKRRCSNFYKNRRFILREY